LVLEVQDEPQLQARIGYGEMYLMPSGEIQRSVHIRVLVYVEYAPDLVVIPPSTPPLLASFLSLTICRMLDKRCRNTSEAIDDHDHVTTISARPIHYVPLFGPLTLYKHKDLAASSPLRCTSYRPAAQ